MTRVLIIVGGAEPAATEIAECDIAVRLNEECSAAEVVKDRDGNSGLPVKVVTG